MKYPVAIRGFEGQSIEVEPGGFFGGPKLLVDGKPAPTGTKRGQMLLRGKNGKEATATWKPQGMGFDVPQLMVNGEAIKVVEPLPWYAWAWSALPLVMILFGGLLGGVAGAIATLINVKVFRSSMASLGKFVVTGAISVAAVIVYLVLASLLVTAISR